MKKRDFDRRKQIEKELKEKFNNPDAFKEKKLNK